MKNHLKSNEYENKKNSDLPPARRADPGGLQVRRLRPLGTGEPEHRRTGCPGRTHRRPRSLAGRNQHQHPGPPDPAQHHGLHHRRDARRAGRRRGGLHHQLPPHARHHHLPRHEGRQGRHGRHPADRRRAGRRRQLVLDAERRTPDRRRRQPHPRQRHAGRARRPRPRRRRRPAAPAGHGREAHRPRHHHRLAEQPHRSRRHLPERGRRQDLDARQRRER